MFHLTLIIFFGLKLSRGQPKLICFRMRRCLTSALIHLTKGPFVWRYHHVTTSIMNITTFININNRYKERMMKFVKNFILQANGRLVRDVRTLWKFDSSKRFSFLHKFHNYFNTRVILKLAVYRHWYEIKIKKNITWPSTFPVSSYTTTIVLWFTRS